MWSLGLLWKYTGEDSFEFSDGRRLSKYEALFAVWASALGALANSCWMGFLHAPEWFHADLYRHPTFVSVLAQHLRVDSESPGRPGCLCLYRGRGSAAAVQRAL